MTEKDLYIIIGIKEAQIYTLSHRVDALTSELEAARAQLKELARDGNSTVQPDLS